MNKICVLIILITSAVSFSKDKDFLRCRVTTSEWNAFFILKNFENGLLKLKKKSGNLSYVCTLKVNYFSDERLGRAPNLTIDFKREECNPSLGSLEQEVFSDYSLIINFLAKKITEGRVQWLKRSQPDVCKIEKLDLHLISKD